MGITGKVFDLLCGWQNGELIILQMSGIVFFYVCCGLYGGKGIDVFLKMWNA